MTGMIPGLMVSAVWMTLNVVFARREYRREYRMVYGSPSATCDGGKADHYRAHEVALREAYQWLAFWPFYLCWAGIARLISGPKPLDTLIDEAQAEVDRLADEQDPLRAAAPDLPGFIESVAEEIRPVPCPCGYTIECSTHCGYGECHRYGSGNVHSPLIVTGACECRRCTDRQLRERYINSPVIGDRGPEIITTRGLDFFTAHRSCGDIRVLCEMFDGTRIFVDGRGHTWEDRS